MKKHIEKSTDQEISKKIKEELQFLIHQYTNNNKLLIKHLKEQNPRFDDFFKELKRSLAIYKEYKRRHYEKSLIPEGKGVVKKIAHQLVEIQKNYILQQIFNENNPDVQNLKEILKENLYNNTILTLKEKATIIKSIRKDKLNEEDKNKLISVLSKLPTDDLISLLGKEYFKQVNWHEISDNWVIQVYTGTGYKTITLNPYQDCSKSNPLYMHEKWLEWVYNNKELNLNDLSIAEICGLNNKTIGNWRKKFNISTKIVGHYFKKGYKFLNMPKEYKHPELNPMGDKKVYRAEHIIMMEEYLNKTLTLKELSLHPCLIKNDGKYYIKKSCVVHHKNHIRLDNIIKNLWLYKNKHEHSNSNINMCFSDLIKLGQILFTKGVYYLNRGYDYRNLKPEEIDKVRKQNAFVDYENLDLVRKTIKNMDWSSTSMNWDIEYQIRNNAPIEKIHLNPNKICSKENPLYRHRGWVERVVRDKRFFLTDRRLSALCGISERSARRWRWEKFNIPAEYWGFDRYIGVNSSGKKIIFKKVSKDYGNPFAVEKVNSAIMQENRYIMEQHLAQDSELNKKYLINGKYLKPEYLVHHINLDNLDNRLENLYLCKNHSEHNRIHSSLIKLIDELLGLGLMIFDNGKYFLACP